MQDADSGGKQHVLSELRKNAVARDAELRHRLHSSPAPEEEGWRGGGKVGRNERERIKKKKTSGRMDRGGS